MESVLIINRRPSGIRNPKLKEIIHADLSDLSLIRDKLSGYNACFFCLGVSAIGLNENEYLKLTHTLTLNFATTLSKMNPGMTFCYVSGSGTDNTEKKKSMWARVKGKTENDLMKLPFKAVYNFRPGYMHPTKGLKRTLKAYNYLSWLYPLVRSVLPNYVSTLKEMGQAMIKIAKIGYEKKVLEVKDIKKAANSDTN